MHKHSDRSGVIPVFHVESVSERDVLDPESGESMTLRFTMVSNDLGDPTVCSECGSPKGPHVCI